MIADLINRTTDIIPQNLTTISDCNAYLLIVYVIAIILLSINLFIFLLILIYNLINCAYDCKRYKELSELHHRLPINSKITQNKETGAALTKTLSNKNGQQNVSNDQIYFEKQFRNVYKLNEFKIINGDCIETFYHQDKSTDQLY